MSGPSDLFDLCVEYLDAAAAGVATTDAGALNRVYVSPGVPAFDCEQLTVHAGGPAEGDTLPLQPPVQPGFRDLGVGSLHLINLTATVVRCIANPQGKQPVIPTAAQLHASAKKVNDDVWAIWNYVRAKHRAGQIFTRPDGQGRPLIFDPAVAVATSGGFAGFQVQIRVQLDGYAPDVTP